MTTPDTPQPNSTSATRAASATGRPKPHPLAEWCGSCDRWMLPPSFVCRCNDR